MLEVAGDDDAVVEGFPEHASCGCGCEVALEALAHGRPLLCADCGALPEVVGTAARLLPPDDAKAWAAAIESLAAGQDATAWDARRAQAAKFSWQASAGMLLATWRRVAAR